MSPFSVAGMIKGICPGNPASVSFVRMCEFLPRIPKKVSSFQRAHSSLLTRAYYFCSAASSNRPYLPLPPHPGHYPTPRYQTPCNPHTDLPPSILPPALLPLPRLHPHQIPKVHPLRMERRSHLLEPRPPDPFSNHQPHLELRNPDPALRGHQGVSEFLCRAVGVLC